MIDCAENIRGYYEAAAGLIFEDGYIPPEEFRPGVADRFLFSKIIDDDWERVLDIYCCAPLHPRMIGFGLMIEKYYPQYGTFRKMSEEEKRERMKLKKTCRRG